MQSKGFKELFLDNLQSYSSLLVEPLPSKAVMDESVSFPLPRSLGTRIHMRLITKERVLMVHLTTVNPEEVGNAVPMGSMVYALPDVR